jgi:hypothetical protein
MTLLEDEMTLPLYMLTVKRYEANPAFDPDKHGLGDNIYGRPEPSATIERIVLTMHVTNEQFDAIRRAALEVAK